MLVQAVVEDRQAGRQAVVCFWCWTLLDDMRFCLVRLGWQRRLSFLFFFWLVKKARAFLCVFNISVWLSRRLIVSCEP